VAYFEDTNGGEGDLAEAEMNEMSRGIAAYLETVREDEAFETVLLPVGEGVAVSHCEW